MGAQAYTHLLTRTTSRVSYFYLTDIPQDYQSLMFVLTGQCTTSSGGGDNTMYCGSNIEGVSGSAIYWNKGPYLIAGNSQETVLTGVYNSTSPSVGTIFNSMYMSVFNDVYNSVKIFAWDYADANTTTTFTYEAGSIWFGTGTGGTNQQPAISIAAAGNSSTEATTAVSIGPNGQWSSGMRLSVYGLGNS